MIPLLGPTDPFPPVTRALDEPNGLIAAGGGLSVERLIDGYSRGIFPWFSDGDPVLWWSPNPRMVLATDGLHVSRSLRRRLQKRDYGVTLDRAFERVLDGCAAPRRDDNGTWLVASMVRAYTRLFRAGYAHSIEVWMGDELIGGLYGVAVGRMFYGESMFSRRTDGSKIALACLCAQLSRWRFPIVDCQMRTAHLASLGARDMPRREFVALVARLVTQPGKAGPWMLDADLLDEVAGPGAKNSEPRTD
jgi:leucyl/phenylalanyl-tRNA--protein transferase